MRIFGNAYELMSEMGRDLWEMGSEVRPRSFQNKIIEGNDDFITKENNNYHYRLVELPDPDNLYLFSKPGSKEWVKAEFAERINPSTGNPGEAWKIRKEEWEVFLNEQGKMDYTYPERLHDHGALQNIANELHRNPGSRQCWLPVFHPKDVLHLGGSRRIPCTLGYNFSIRKGELNLTYIQRSADYVSHLGNDIHLAWMMMEHMANRVGVEPGYLDHFIFSIHSYKRDWATLEAGISKL